VALGVGQNCLNSILRYFERYFELLPGFGHAQAISKIAHNRANRPSSSPQSGRAARHSRFDLHPGHRDPSICSAGSMASSRPMIPRSCAKCQTESPAGPAALLRVSRMRPHFCFFCFFRRRLGCGLFLFLGQVEQAADHADDRRGLRFFGSSL
jgi:hypothetical protein